MSALTSRPHRYRITVTPVEADGLQCPGRCSIEFDQACGEDWMRRLESLQRTRGLSGDERSSLLVALQLLQGLMQRHLNDPQDPFVRLRPQLGEFVRSLDVETQP